MKKVFLFVALSCHLHANASNERDVLVQIKDASPTARLQLMRALPKNSQVESLGVANWYRVKVSSEGEFRAQQLLNNSQVLKVQPNYTIRPYESPALAAIRSKLMATPMPKANEKIAADNPAIPGSGSGGSGADPLFSSQWGMSQINVQAGWEKSVGSPEMVVAVIDTGVDYTHEDLVDNLWRNPGEMGRDAQGRDKATNGVDDDSNGYIDDQVGWDFAGNDSKPYDLTKTFYEIIFQGGNPGHGTHCAGNVAARHNNGKGIAGVAPNVKIMVLRFITENGQGTTADAIKAVRYAADNGAKVTSNSWGSEGEDANDPESAALKDAIRYAESKGVLFIAAAGNGHQGRGYDNDTDSKPAYPASYDMENIVSVAAIDVNGNLGSFSNWGRRSVDLGAPGVKVFSTVPGNIYQDSLGNFFGQELNWDGTSMATPHVAGAAALYWSAHPEKTWREVKDALLSSVKKTSVLGSKTVSGGQLDVGNLMR